MVATIIDSMKDRKRCMVGMLIDYINKILYYFLCFSLVYTAALLSLASAANCFSQDHVFGGASSVEMATCMMGSCHTVYM